MKRTFAELFKKYRLRAEFEKLSELGDALAEKGNIYEDSLFSHWQKGNRIPHNRTLLLALIHIFIERKAIISIDDANEFLSSSNQGYLTKEEIADLPSAFSSPIPFQLPREPSHFTGREDLLQIITNKLSNNGIVLLHGPSGVGKTSFAIHIGHKLRHLFPDGVLWYKVDTANPMDILLSIAQTFNENISPIQDIEIRASIVRSILANKKILLILDNVENDTNIRVLLPNSSSSVIITSKHTQLLLETEYESINIASFTQEEAVQLFNKILPKEYIKTYKRELLQIGEKVDNLPLALTIYTKQLLLTKNSPIHLLKNIEQNKIALDEMSYEDKNLYISIDISYQSLPEKAKTVFLSLGVFEGKDFSLEAITAINVLTKDQSQTYISQLMEASLISESKYHRYQIHSTIKQYIKTKTDLKKYIPLLAKYYAVFLEKNKRKHTKSYKRGVFEELENILFVFEECSRLKIGTGLPDLWKNLGMFFFQTGLWDKAFHCGKIIYAITKTNKDYRNHVKYSINILFRMNFLLGNWEICWNYINESLGIAEKTKDELITALSNQQLGKQYHATQEFEKSIYFLHKSILSFEEASEIEELLFSLKYMSEAYMFQNKYQQAMETLLKAINLAKKYHDTFLFGVLFSLLGTIYYVTNNYLQAKKFLTKAINIEKENNVRVGIRVFNNLTLALISHKNKQISQAERYFQLAKDENSHLQIKHKAKEIYPIVFLIYEDLQKAGYNIF